MTPGRLRGVVVTERSEWVREMLERLRALPLGSLEAFTADRRNVDAAESCLRRALEALLDLGRHLLAKGFGDAPAEYREVARLLAERGVLGAEDGAVFERMAGYRNRMIHFYDRVSDAELHEICATRLHDIERVLAGIHAWLAAHPDRIDGGL
jgi:uncharacterized protein YutE (UPF0331/DUF86 family)